MCSFHNLYPLFTNIRQTAFITIRCSPRGTHGTSVIDKTMAEFTALLRWHDLPKFHLNFFRILDAVHQPYPALQQIGRAQG